MTLLSGFCVNKYIEFLGELVL